MVSKEVEKEQKKSGKLLQQLQSRALAESQEALQEDKMLATSQVHCRDSDLVQQRH